MNINNVLTKNWSTQAKQSSLDVNSRGTRRQLQFFLFVYTIQYDICVGYLHIVH